MGKNSKHALDIPVQFGGVSLGDATARLGLKIDRSVCNITTADDTFCGHRLSGRVILGGSDDTAGQGRLVDDLDHHVDAVFDVKRFGANAKEISTSLTFSLKDVDLLELSKLSKGSGRLIIDNVAELPEDEGDDTDDDISLQAPSTLKVTGPLRDVQLDTLFHGALLKSLKKGGLATVGQLTDFTGSDKKLTDIAGIGPEKAEKIQNQMVAFWKQNPEQNWDSEKQEPATEPIDWRQAPLSALGLAAGVCEMFSQHGVTTIAGLIELKANIDDAKAVWPRGVGPAKAEDVCKRLDDFRDKHEAKEAAATP